MPKPPQSFASLKRHIADSHAVVIHIHRGAEIAAEVSVAIGVSLLLGKPIIAVIRPGATVSAKLATVVDRFIECDVDHPHQCYQAVAKAVKEIAQKTDKP